MNDMVDWNAVRDFLAVVDEGSITAASEKLAISQPTLSRRLKVLEQRIGAQLLVRGPRHLRLTDAGQKFWDQAQQMGRAAKALDLTGVVADEMTGRVRVSATEGLAATWLTDQLANFMRIYPGILVDLVVDNQFTDLIGRDADIAVRLQRPAQKELVTSNVGTLTVGFYAHSEYVARRGVPDSVRQLAGHDVIGLSGTRRFPVKIAQALSGGRVVFRTRNIIGAFRAVQAGIGIGPAYYHMGHLADDCVPVLGKMPMIEEQVWLTALPEYRENKRIRVLYRFLAEAFRENRERLNALGDAP